jgi:hypothetical protein
MTSPAPADAELRKQRQVVFWRLLGAAFGLGEQARNLEQLTADIAEQHGLPPLITDPNLAVETLLQRYPELKPDFDSIRQACNPGGDEEKAEASGGRPPPVEGPDEATLQPADLRRALAYSKLLLNVFGPSTLSPVVTAQQYSQWCQDVGLFEACLGFQPGELRAKGKAGGPGQGGPGVSGAGRLVTEEQLQAGLSVMEGDLIKRMALREVLQDDVMAARLTPSMTLVEQLLLDKSNLSGAALKNAKALIKRFVDQLAEVLKAQVSKAVRGKIDRSVPPKRVFRNLDLRRTLWKNLIHFNPEDRRLYVDQLFYRRTATKDLPNRLIVVVDQSGSMVNAMVQTAILASIFAGLPKVDVHLIAFDTNVLDLTAYVHDPFEVLMRTNLGGGNDGPKAMIEALRKVAEPRQTTMVWISDFYEFQNDRPLFEQIKAVKESGTRFIPVGALQSTGYFSVNEWFRVRLKEIGLPILSGSVKKLIEELKGLL